MSVSATKYAISVSEFSKLPSVSRLKELAKTPVDLTAPSLLSPQRIADYTSQGCGFSLSYATQRIDDKVLEALSALAKETKAVEQNRRMQSGEVINKIDGYDSENRAVLHTAMRDFWDDKIESGPAKEAAALAKEQLDKLEAFNDKVLCSGKFTDLIMVGIGGSDLGPRALYLALEKHLKPGRRVHFIANVDPDDPAQVLADADLGKALVVVVSKSGTTLETLTNELFVRSRFEKAGLDPANHFVAVTAKGSPMDDTSKYLSCFHMWDYVGGRYSATSMVGGVMLSFAIGFKKYVEILQGANAMDKHALEEEPRKNLPLLMALLGVWNRNFLECPTIAVIPYSQGLWRFPAHLQQCDMESNGKQIERNGSRLDIETGPIVWGEPGTNGQHSFFQLIHQGTATTPVEFIGFKESQRGEDIEVQGTSSQQKLLANLFAQALALAKGQDSDNPNKVFPGNRPSSVLIGKQLTPYAVGALLALYEHKIAFQGFIWNINSFDQEGVQLGKVLANQFIDLMAGRKEASDFPEGAAMLKLLEQV